jgi:hypothetical protein
MSWTKTLGMLVSRLVLFGLFQALIALVYLSIGAAQPWRESTAWWPLTAVLTNLVVLYLLHRLAKAEGLSGLGSLYYGWRRPIKRELLIAVGLFILAGPLSMGPQSLLGQWIFGDPNGSFEIMFRPLPLWAAYPLMILFPLTIALAELPTYYAYVMPRLEAQTGSALLAVGLSTFFLSAQHIALPLVFDGRFILFRLLVFLPFALMLGIALRLRPSLLPYLMIGHGLIDLATIVVVLMVSLGRM